jgi:hypothetical protein
LVLWLIWPVQRSTLLGQHIATERSVSGNF